MSCYVILMNIEVKQKKWHNQAVVVEECKDVILDELPRLPTKREVEFPIILVPGATLVSLTPYRMALVELEE